MALCSWSLSIVVFSQGITQTVCSDIQRLNSAWVMLSLLTLSGFWIELNERVPPLASHNCVPCLTGLHGLGTPPEHHHRQEDEGEGHALSHLAMRSRTLKRKAPLRGHRPKCGAPKGPPPPTPVNTILGPPPKSNSGRVGGAAKARDV